MQPRPQAANGRQGRKGPWRSLAPLAGLAAATDQVRSGG